MVESQKITVLLPCRAGSQRVVKKNTKPFFGSSLLEIKLNQLLHVNKIEKIIVSTDDEDIKSICRKYNNEKISIHDRDPYYASSECSNDDFVKYFAQTLDFKGHLLWTHVTSPFCTEETYNRAIEKYFKLEDRYDSLISVDLLQGYIWGKDAKPLNYDVSKIGKWPKTQEVDPCFLINSAIFLIPLKLMKKINDRVGEKPYFFQMDHLESFDIDWPDDFELAQKLWSSMYN